MRQRVFGLAMLVALVLSVPLRAAERPVDEQIADVTMVEVHLLVGRDLLKAGDSSGAAAHFERAVTTFPAEAGKPFPVTDLITSEALWELAEKLGSKHYEAASDKQRFVATTILQLLYRGAEEYGRWLATPSSLRDYRAARGAARLAKELLAIEQKRLAARNAEATEGAVSSVNQLFEYLPETPPAPPIMSTDGDYYAMAAAVSALVDGL